MVTVVIVIIYYILYVCIVYTTLFSNLMSSLSMNKVRGRALNANTQNTNNFSMWMEPLSHKDYPVTYIANPTNNAVITSNGVKNVAVAQAGLLYNQARLDVSGSVNPTRWTTGQTINTVFLDATNINQPSTNYTSGTHTIASYSYTPVSNKSKIIVEYGANYIITGFNNDLFVSYIIVDNTNTIAKREQFYENQPGGGGRSSTLFPICGSITNNGTAARNIIVSLVVTSDSVDFTGRNNAYDSFIRITEISQ